MRPWKLLAAGIVLASLGFRQVVAEPMVDRGKAGSEVWSGYWWPVHLGGLTEPLGKYDLLAGRKAVLWEEEHGRANPDAPPWHGYCHGQAAAGLLEKEPRSSATLVVSGREIPIGIGDQKGWLVACHTADPALVYGERFTADSPSSARDDLAPDQLWHILQLYIREQGVPIVVDVEPGEEVWNYPVYGYEVRYQPADAGHRYRGQMTLWMADTAVPPDFVGLRIRKHEYTFTFEMEDERVILGSGKWTGLSRRDHPDFAWYPYAAAAENPEVDPPLVQELIKRVAAQRYTPGEPSERPQEVPVPTDTPPESPQGEPRPPEPFPPVVTSPALWIEDTLVSPHELVSLLVSRTSSFKLDVSVDRFDGASYAPSETYSIYGTTERPGHLYLFMIDPAGTLSLLFPLYGQDNRVQQTIRIPRAEDLFAFRVPNQPGLYRIRAIVTSKPIRLVGLVSEVVEKSKPNSPSASEGKERASITKGQALIWHPASRELAARLLATGERQARGVAELPRDMDLQQLLGPFAQDEVAFYVRAGAETQAKD
jgi:hypothetical protein